MPLYTPPFAGGVSNLGNTSGTTGTVLQRAVLVGGDNITLSQSVSGQSATISISGASGGVGGGGGTFGMSNLGNTSGTTGVVQSQIVLAGGNNVTLSQSINGQSATLTISAANSGTAPPIATAGKQVASARSTGTVTRFAPEDHAHEGIAQVQISGNTSNTSNVVLGSLVLAGGNNVTLSQVSAAGAATVTISAANETQTVPPIATAVKAEVSTVASTGTITRFAPEDHLHKGVNSAGISTGGNTSGNTGVIPGRIVLAGGNNITLSGGTDATGATITISAGAGGGGAVVSNALQPVSSETGSGTNTSRFAADDHVHRGVYTFGVSTGGNTSGDTKVGPGRFVLAGGSNITLSQGTAANELNTITIIGPTPSAAALTLGMSNLGNTSGTTGTVNAQLIVVGGNNITVSQSVNGQSATLTISAFTQSVQTLSFYDNMGPGATATSSLVDMSLHIYPLTPFNEILGGNITPGTIQLNFSVGTISTAAPFTRSVSLAFYTMNNSAQLSRIFSASTSWGSNAANASFNSSFNGPRWVTFHSSQFDVQPTFSNTRYWVAIWTRSSSGTGSWSIAGIQTLFHSATRSGTMGAASNAATTLGMFPFAGVFSVTFSSAMPAGISASDINHNVAAVNFLPQVVLNNRWSVY
jgi:hypothetical protein